MNRELLIVIADDDLDDQDLMQRGLTEFRVNLKIAPVYNGLQLLDYLLKKNSYKNVKESPDLILLDLNMPLMDGFDVLTEIKKHESLKKIPIYILTTSRNKKDREKALRFGANGFYSKGSSSEEILKIMQAICVECFA
jgi:CheY-like chemotaxis protein